MREMAETFASLEAEYCPPIDAALLSAILSDFDLSRGDAVGQAREILNGIRVSALEEEDSAFDPSGSSNIAGVSDGNGLFGVFDSGAVQDEATDSTSLSTGLHSLDLSNDSDTPDISATSVYVEEIEALDDTVKLAMLTEMFPDMNEYSISHTLHKCGSKYYRALDELLNHNFFTLDSQSRDEGEIVNSKSVDAFAEDVIRRRGRKKKTARKLLLSTLDKSTEQRSGSLPVSPGSPWANAHNEEIEFVSSRVRMSTSRVTSIYHQNGASVQKTIKAILEGLDAESTAVPRGDRAFIHNVLQLGHDFPTIPSPELAALIRLTSPSTSKAHELARVYTQTARSDTGDDMHIVPHYAPIQFRDSSPPSDSRPSTSASYTASGSSDEPTVQADRFSDLQHRAFASASSAARRGRSDHLMGQAAGYYSQLGHDYSRARMAATAAAADQLVAAQSTLDHVDLHGVYVVDAVRIAKDRAERWWRSRQGKGVMGLDGRVMRDGPASASATPLRIVTGAGRHSEGGRGKLGPAVGKMLAREGWIFEVGMGALIVSGARR